MTKFPKSTLESFLRAHNIGVAGGVAEKLDEIVVEYVDTLAQKLATIVRHRDGKAVKVEDFELLEE